MKLKMGRKNKEKVRETGRGRRSTDHHGFDDDLGFRCRARLLFDFFVARIICF